MLVNRIYNNFNFGSRPCPPQMGRCKLNQNKLNLARAAAIFIFFIYLRGARLITGKEFKKPRPPFLQFSLRGKIMANPQKENGYTPIANDIMDALCKIRISGEEWQCLGVILRKTYGWNKILDEISLSQFTRATGIKKQNICRALNRLLSKKIISIIKKDNGITEYSLQKDYEKWEPLSKKITLSKKIKPIIKKDKETPQIVIKKETHKNKYKTTSTKDTSIAESKNKKKEKSKKEWSPRVKFLIGEYFKTLTEAQQLRFEKQRDKFHSCCDKLLRIDGFSEEEIRKAVNFARYDYFWSQNFLSFLKLRQKDKSGTLYIEVFLNRLEKQKKKEDSRGSSPNTKAVDPKMTEEEKEVRYGKPDDTSRLLKEIEEREAGNMEVKNEQ